MSIGLEAGRGVIVLLGDGDVTIGTCLLDGRGGVVAAALVMSPTLPGVVGRSSAGSSRELWRDRVPASVTILSPSLASLDVLLKQVQAARAALASALSVDLAVASTPEATK